MTKKEIIEAQTLCNTWLKDLTPDEINHIEDMMEEYATSLADEMKADLTSLIQEESIEFGEWLRNNEWSFAAFENEWVNLKDDKLIFKTTSELYELYELYLTTKNKAR